MESSSMEGLLPWTPESVVLSDNEELFTTEALAVEVSSEFEKRLSIAPGDKYDVKLESAIFDEEEIDTGGGSAVTDFVEATVTKGMGMRGAGSMGREPSNMSATIGKVEFIAEIRVPGGVVFEVSP